MSLESVIDRLAQDARPVRPLRAPRAIAFWLSFAVAAVTLLCAGRFGVRSDLPTAFHALRFWLSFPALTVLALCAIYRAILTGLPGRRPAVWSSWGIAFSLASLGTAAALSLAQSGARGEWATGTDPHGFACTTLWAILAIAPLIFPLPFLRRLAPVTPSRSARWLGVASGATAAAGLCFVCASPSMVHLCLWHVVPVFLLALVCAPLGRLLWRW